MSGVQRMGVKVEVGERAIRVENALFTLELDLVGGSYSVTWRDGAELVGAQSAYRLTDGATVTTADYAEHRADAGAVLDVEDAIGGRGVRITVVHVAAKDGEGEGESEGESEGRGGKPVCRQQFTVYESQPFLTVGVELEGADGGDIETNYVAPVLAGDPVGGAARLGLPEGHELRGLLVPFDNDKWVRYESVPMPGALESYEATTIYDPQSRKGLVLGSITHDTWKTGLKLSSAVAGRMDAVEAYGGAAGELTRDTIPHGAVKGKTVSSPVIFLGSYEDYRDGLEAFGRANAAVKPALPWEHGMPFGWNSWSAVADKLDYDVYVQTSDFLRSLKDGGFENDGVVYVNFDSFWTSLSENQLRQAVKHVNGNGQKAGIYWTPFAFWGQDPNVEVEGTDGRYTYADLLLRDWEGNVLPDLDGGLAIDPTHPGNLMRTDYHLNRFVEWGYEYVKLDFLGHGALEGKHYDPSVHTGIQAYNLGMDYICRTLAPERIGRPFHINLSIAPIFPHGYGHSRRISCDAFGTLADTEYMLNSLTYGWWMNNTLYRFNDPDHTVLYKSFNQDATSCHEGRSRLNASIIAGTVLLLGDDFRQEEARTRASEWLANEKLLSLARLGRTFVPVESGTGSGASNVFMLREGERIVLAVFNFDNTAPAQVRIPLERLGVEVGTSIVFLETDFWGGDFHDGKEEILVSIEVLESTLFELIIL
ncbi:alpha-galactosidase [Cohnella xylanilytica]|uniref:Alpha-galactosidase n=1 Tax=Cohnella xylanilytica TaxID=557555 RepID=A0A841TZ96_9BACL|nr:alpha-galactosidase [Cohnella xylanilytica]MBB6693555.1 alpha-galactosidase [Cohnella xylanilytica]